MSEPARRPPLPRWLGTSSRRDSIVLRDPRPSGRPRVRRHARVAVLAVVAAAGVAFVRPGNLGLLGPSDDPGASGAPIASPVAAAVAPAPTAVSVELPSTAPIPTAAAPVASSPPSLAASTAANSPTGLAAGSAAAGAAAGSTGTAPVVTESLTRSSHSADQPVPVDRRRAQTWDPPASPSDLEGYVWPLARGYITNPFGPSPWGSHVVDGALFHDGIDIASFCGDRIVAAHDGIVLAAGRKFDPKIGWVGDLTPYLDRLQKLGIYWELPITVVIDDGNGYRSIYAHFYALTVKVGQRVQAGQLIGYEGATGRATGCHLHYGLFSPHETATMALEPKVVKQMLSPAAQIARIDPLLVLPPRPPSAAGEAPTPTTSHDAGPHDAGG